MKRAFASFFLVLTWLVSLSSAQDQIPIQLRLTSATEDKVDYYLAPAGGSPTHVGAIEAGSTVQIDARQGQVYLFAVNRVPFQKFTVRAEKFQHLTVGAKEQQRLQVASEYQSTPDAMQPPEQMGRAPAMAPQQAPAAMAPQQNAGPPDANGLAWQYSRFNNEAEQGAVNTQLVLGIPETDAVQFFAVCSARTRGNPVSQLSTDVTGLAAGSPIRIRFVAQGLDRSLDGTVVQPESEEGLQGVRLVIPADDPLWQTLPRLANAIYSAGGRQAVAIPFGGIAQPLKSFLQDCRAIAGAGSQIASSVPATGLFQDDAAAGQPPQQPQAAAVGPDTCARMKNVRSKAGGAPLNLTFVNRTNEFRFVLMVDDDGTLIEFANLQGGESAKVDTTTSQVWMLTDGPGNCIEMMVPKQGRNVFEITRPSPGFGPEGD